MLVLLVAFPDVTALGLATALGQAVCADSICEAIRLTHIHCPNIALAHVSCAERIAPLAELVPTLLFGEEKPPGQYDFIDSRISLGDLRLVTQQVAAGEELPSQELPSITPAEMRVLRLIANGMSNREIALQLGLQAGTVRNYVSDLLDKLELESRTQLALYARDWRLG